MKIGRSFFDTDVLLYLLSEDNRKADRAEVIIATGGIISVQVLNEFASVASRTGDELCRNTRCVRDGTCGMSNRGLNIAERFGYSLDDSMIVSSALQSGCSVLYSADMQHGQEIDAQLVVVNPFLDN